MTASMKGEDGLGDRMLHHKRTLKRLHYKDRTLEKNDAIGDRNRSPNQIAAGLHLCTHSDLE